MKKVSFGKGKVVMFMLFVMLFIVAGCSEESGKSAEQPKDAEKTKDTEDSSNKEEVTITIAHPFGEDIFNDRYATIEDLPDHIKLDWVYWDETREGLEELFSKGIEPDIFNSGSVELLQEYEAIIPIDELIEKHDFDTSVIQPSHLSFLESFDSEQRMIGVPDGSSYYALFFNKEIFDLFGVPYPDLEKSMTWDEVLKLAAKLTAERNGTEYIGLEFHNNDMSAPLKQFGMNLTDPETKEVLVTEKPELQQYFEMVRDYNDIPGIDTEKIAESCKFCEKQAAMSISWHGLFLWGWGEDPAITEMMDIAPLPVWPEKPTTGPYLASYPIMVSSFSKHPDEAFQVLMGYVSEQNQLAMSKAVAAGPVTVYPTVTEGFAELKEFYDGKNIPAIFALEPEIGEERQSAKWDRHVNIGSALNKLATTAIDVPTLLRELKEESEISIKDAEGTGE